NDVEVAPAGFYSETEHLFVVDASSAAWDRIDERMRSHPLVEGIEPEMVYALPEGAMSAYEGPLEGIDDLEVTRPGRFQPDDPMFALQWHMEQISAPEAWSINRGAGAVVAVIDTGVAW